MIGYDVEFDMLSYSTGEWKDLLGFINFFLQELVSCNFVKVWFNECVNFDNCLFVKWKMNDKNICMWTTL